MIVTQIAYTDSYNKPESQAINVIKRPFTDEEYNHGIEMFKRFQRMLRAIAVVALIFGLIMIFVDTNTVYGLVLMLMALIFGSLSLGMAPFIFRVRKQIDETLKEGTAIEVRGTASKSRATWTVGPISLLATKELNGMIREGMQVSVMCIPKMKLAFSVNNVALKRITRMTCQSDIESSAVFETSVPPGQPLPPPPPYQTTGQYPPPPPPPESQTPPPQTDLSERLSKLTELKDKGLITEEEFQIKKEELLTI